MDYINVQCSWENVNSENITQVVLVKLNDEESCGKLPAECLRFKQDAEQSTPFEISVALKYPDNAKYRISSVDILCNARFMEVYSGDEYLCTEEGIFLERVENDIRLYILQKSFDNSVRETSLKLVGLQNKNEIAVHSIHVTLCSVSAAQGTVGFAGIPASIDLEKVKDMLPDSQSLPSGAQSLLNAMETFQSNQSQTGQQMSGMAMLMSMFSGMSMKQPSINTTRRTTDISQNSSQQEQATVKNCYETKNGNGEVQCKDGTNIDKPGCLEKEIGSNNAGEISLGSRGDNHCEIETKYRNATNNSNGEKNIDDLHSYIQTQIKASENRLQANFEEKLKSVEEKIHIKLDKILDLISNRNMSTEPSLD